MDTKRILSERRLVTPRLLLCVIDIVVCGLVTLRLVTLCLVDALRVTHMFLFFISTQLC